jgi:tetratricopeptide (TPR) repeat protein
MGALLGALTLAMLARSVVLLPHDRTQAQRDRERSDFSTLSLKTAWLPPLLAALVGGWQLTFWESATANDGEIINVFLLATVVWQLLEFRLDDRTGRLVLAAFAFGLGMANNVMFLALLPCFVLAVLWIRGLAFFNLGFLGRMAAAGLAGWLVFFALPLAMSRGAGATGGFGALAHALLASQKNFLLHMPVRSWWVLGLTSLLPLVVAGIRWASSFGDSSPLGASLAAFVFHLIHGVFLVSGVWLMFDPPFSARQFSLPVGALLVYYFAALSVGYLSGYFLLVFNPAARGAERESSLARLGNVAVTAALWALALLAPLALLCRNLPTLRANQHGHLATFASTLTEQLPAANAVLLSDDSIFTTLVQLDQRKRGQRKNLTVDTQSLPYPAYHRHLHERYGAAWPVEAARTNTFTAVELQQQLQQASAAREIFYLHYSFGYYFEPFFTEPRAGVFKVALFPTNEIAPPAVSAATIAANEAFWKKLDAEFLPQLVRSVPQDQPAPLDFLEKIFTKLHIAREPQWQNIRLGLLLSRTLNCWGVALQRVGEFDKAAHWFARARELNPANAAALLNQECNQRLRAGGWSEFEVTPAINAKLNLYRQSLQMLAFDGPVDEPRFCREFANIFLQNGYIRQAGAEFARMKSLNPSNAESYVWLAQIHNLNKQPDRALELVAQARQLPSARTNLDLVAAEAAARFTRQQPDEAEALLNRALKEFPNDEKFEAVALQTLVAFQRHASALEITRRQLRRQPDDINTLNLSGALYTQLKRYAEAVAAFDRLLEVQPTNDPARFNRAVALFHSGQLEKAQADFATLAQLHPEQYQLQFGLGEIAYQQKDSAPAIEHYENYLRLAPGDTDEARAVRAKLAELKK